MNTRNRLLKEFLKNRSIENESKFKRYRNILRLTLRQAKKQYFQNQFSKHVNNPRLLWENLLEAIQKQKAKPKPASRFEIRGDFITDEKLIAESFNDYYSGVAPALDAALGPSTVDPLVFMQDLAVPETMTFSAATGHLCGHNEPQGGTGRIRWNQYQVIKTNFANHHLSLNSCY